MASVLKVDSIEPANSVTGLKGMPIEVLAGVCDGTAVTVQSGTYTLQDVTGVLSIPTTYTDITGSSIDYTPPNGTSRVIYEFMHQLSWTSDHAISHWKLFLDGAEVTDARHSLSGRYPERIEHHKWVFSIGVSNTAATGAVLNWDRLEILNCRLVNMVVVMDLIEYIQLFIGMEATPKKFQNLFYKLQQ